MTQSHCAWCGRPFSVTARPGRPRRFCRDSCRQRDYESRRRASELGLSEGELVVTRAELEGMRDRLYVLACALADVEKDLATADDEDCTRAFAWLLEAARTAAAS
ncbi:MAG: hypothetical protein ACT4OX_06850 [Actinomycetota bacterium]